VRDHRVAAAAAVVRDHRSGPGMPAMRDQRNPVGGAAGRVVPGRVAALAIDRQRLVLATGQGLRPQPAGVALSALIQPLASASKPKLDEVFVDPKEPSKRYYLPEYRVAEGPMPGPGGVQQRLRVALEPAGPEQAGKLSVVLEPRRPAKLADQSQLLPLPHRLEVLLRYQRPLGGGNGLKVELAFEALSQLADGNWAAQLILPTAADRAGLEQALSWPECQAELVVVCEADLAWPLPAAPTPPAATPVRPRPELPLGMRLGDVRPVGPAAGAIGAGMHAALRGGTARPAPAAGSARAARLNPALLGALLRPRPAAEAAAPEVRYGSGPVRLEQVLAPKPFCFPATDPLLGGANPKANFGQLVPLRVPFGGKLHDYFQISTQPELFFYVPDGFVVGREEDPTSGLLEPAINVAFVAGAGPEDAPRAQVAWRLTPSVDGERLESALLALSAHCPGKQPLLGPLNCPTGLRFSLQLPGQPAMAERPDARIDLVSGIDDRFELSIEGLNSFLDALARGSSLELQGQLSIDLPDLPTLRVPCRGQLETDPALVLASEERGLPDGSMEVRLINRSESALELRRLGARIERGDAGVPARIEGLDLSSPQTMAPGAALDFKLLPVEPLPAPVAGAAEAPLDAVFDLSEASLRVEREVLLNAVLDPSVPARYQRPIEVELDPSEFAPKTDDPARSLLHVIVEFQGGPQVKLDAAQPKVQVSLSRPISEFLRNDAAASSYNYRLVVQRRNGQQREQEWRSDHLDFLYPELPA
jgi:hypothetical protein